jgi:hypothetical protein
VLDVIEENFEENAENREKAKKVSKVRKEEKVVPLIIKAKTSK